MRPNEDAVFFPTTYHKWSEKSLGLHKSYLRRLCLTQITQSIDRTEQCYFQGLCFCSQRSIACTCTFETNSKNVDGNKFTSTVCCNRVCIMQDICQTSSWFTYRKHELVQCLYARRHAVTEVRLTWSLTRLTRLGHNCYGVNTVI